MNSYAVGLHKKELDTPALCLDIEALEANIAEMSEFLADKPASLRPHSKTHKCPTIAWMQIHAGAIGITCAKLGEAEVMARAGIRDILIANQIIGPRKISRLMGLASYTDIMIAVDTSENATSLSEAAAARNVKLRVIIEVDVGMGRCGTRTKKQALELAKLLSSLPGLRFEGIMGYEGHAVMIPDTEQRREAARSAMAELVEVKKYLVSNGIPVGIVSAGGTGTYQMTGADPEITELQAGTYATMDLRYRQVGINFRHALTVVAQVISTSGSDQAVTDAGLKSLTPEFGMPQVLDPEGWETEKLSEEHSSLKRSSGKALKPGDIVEFIPSHGCTTINLHDVYYVTRRGIVEAVWPISGRGAIR